MHNQYTDLLLDLPEVCVLQVMEFDEQTIYIEVCPRLYTQACSICHNADSVIRKGSNRTRKIRHCSIGEKKVFILAPAIRLFCRSCHCGFVWKYSFVAPGKRYSTAFEKQAIRTATAATVKQSAEVHALPASTLQTKHQQWLSAESKRCKSKCGKTRLAPRSLF